MHRAGYVELTRSLIRTSAGLEMAISDLNQAVASAVDAAVLNGSGPDEDDSPLQPLGILRRSDVDVVAVDTNGGPLTHAKLTEAEAILNGRGFDTRSLAWVLSAASRLHAKRAPKISGHPVYLLDDLSGYMNESPAVGTTGFPDTLGKGSGTGLGSAILGHWPSVVVVSWGSPLITLNPYSLDTLGMVRVVVEQQVNFALRSPGVFVIIKNINTTI